MRYIILLLFAFAFTLSNIKAAVDSTFIYVCQGEQVDMHTNFISPVYVWVNKDGVIPNEETSLYSILSAEIADEGIYACLTFADTSVFVLIVDQEPQFITQPLSGAFVDGASFNLSTGINELDTVTYTWYKNDQLVENEALSFLTFSNFQQSDAANYYCIASNSCGDDTSDVATLELVEEYLQIIEGPTDTATCAGDDLVLYTKAEGSGNLVYQWYKDDVAIDQQTLDSLVLTPLELADTGIYYCVVTLNTLIDTTYHARLFVRDFSGLQVTPDTSVCMGSSIQLDADGAVAYRWSNGVEDSLIHVTPLVNTTYTVTALGENDCLAIASVSVTVYELPVANAGNDTVVCGTTPIVLTASGGDSYLWNEGTVSASITVAPLSTTNYTVTATDVHGCTDSDIIKVSVSAIPVANAGLDKTICYATDTLLIAKGGVAYLWHTGETNDTIRVAPLTDSIYSVTVTNAKGCTDDDQVKVFVTPQILADAGHDTTICAGNSLILSAIGGVSYSWSTGATIDIDTVTPMQSITYTVTVSDLTTCSATDEIIVTVNQTPIANAGNDLTICNGGQTVLYAAGGDTYQWSTMDSEQIIFVTPSADSTFYVTVSLANGCQSIDSISVFVSDTLIPYAGLDTAICLSDSVMLFATGGIDFNWNNGFAMDDSTVANPDVAPTSTTDFIVTISDGVCTAQDTVRVQVNELPDILITEEQSICIGASADLMALGGVSYVWSTGDSIGVIAVSPLNSEVYTVTVTNTASCSATNTVLVNVISLPVPEAGEDLIICRGNQAALTGEGGVDYNWSDSQTGEVVYVTPAMSTQYIVTVISAAGCTASDSVFVEVNEPSVFIVQPESHAVCAGDSVVLQVALTGGGLSYQWRKNSVDIFGETDSLLILADFASSDTAIYTCAVTNVCSTMVSNASTLSLSNTVLLTQPLDKIKCKGETLILSVQAKGSSVEYQWQQNGMDIPGATSASYIVQSTDVGNSGVYRCQTNACDKRLSDSAVVTINYKPIILQQPISTSYCDGEKIELAIAVDGSEPLTYQWKKGTVDIIGATDSIFVIDSASYLDKGAYTCMVTNMCGYATSTAATLQFNGPAITKQPVAKSVCPGADVLFSVTATGASAYQWLKDGEVIAGADTYMLGVDDIDMADEALYSCLVFNACGFVKTNDVKLDVDVPTILKQPANDTLCEGTNINYTIDVAGSSLIYNWYFNGALNSQAATSMLSIQHASKSKEGYYYCKVSNTCGVTYTDSIHILINEPSIITQPLPIDACLNDSVAFMVQGKGYGLTYQWKKGAAFMSGETDSILIIKQVRASDAASYSCIVSNNCGDVTSQQVSLTINHPAIANSINSYLVCPNDSISFNTIATGKDLVYQWYKNNTVLTGEDSSFFYLADVTNADTAMYYCVVSNTCDADTSKYARIDFNMPIITHQPVDADICWGSSGAVSLNNIGFGVIYQWYRNNKPINGATSRSYTFSKADTSKVGTFYCKLSNICATTYTDTITLRVNYAKVNLSENFVCEGFPVDLTLFKVGSASEYIWKRNSVAIATTAAPTLTIEKATKEDIGLYTCEINGSCGKYNSFSDTLSVQYLSVQPETKYLKVGDSITFKVKSTGTITSYAWFKEGTQIPGATDSIYKVASFTMSDLGAYMCLLTGDCGTFTSEKGYIHFDDGSAVNELALADKINMYPNPASDLVNVSLDMEGDVSFNIYDNRGLLVYSDKFVKNNSQDVIINTSHLSQGVYQCHITHEGNRAIKKLVILK